MELEVGKLELDLISWFPWVSGLRSRPWPQFLLATVLTLVFTNAN